MQLLTTQTRSRDLEVSMTPMIDVVFLLLIFFVCTASFQQPESILSSHLLLPEGAQSPSLPDSDWIDLERIVIRLACDSQSVRSASTPPRSPRVHYAINEQPCPTITDLKQLLQELANIDPALPVVLDIAKEVPLGRVIDTYDACRLAGFAQIQFAATMSR